MLSVIFCWRTAVLTYCLVALLFHQRIHTHPLPTEDAWSGISTSSNLRNPAYPLTTCWCHSSSSLSLLQTCNRIKFMKQDKGHALPGPITCSKIKLTGRQRPIQQWLYISLSLATLQNVFIYSNNVLEYSVAFALLIIKFFTYVSHAPLNYMIINGVIFYFSKTYVDQNMPDYYPHHWVICISD